MAKIAFQDRKKLFIGKVNVELTKRIVKCLVWYVAMYAAETWTLTEMDKRRIEAFEMWIWRRMERISYMDKVANEDVLKRVDEDRSILNGIWQRQHRWIGHVLRLDSFLQEIFKGRMMGKKTRARRRIQMLHDLMVNSNYATLKQTDAERVPWRHNRGISSTCSMAED